MTDPAELAKLIEELRAFPKDLGERITSDATMRHICLKPMYDTGDLAEALARHICGKAAAMLDQLASTMAADKVATGMPVLDPTAPYDGRARAQDQLASTTQKPQISADHSDENADLSATPKTVFRMPVVIDETMPPDTFKLVYEFVDTEELREKVARAICWTNGMNPDLTLGGDGQNFLWHEYIPQADAAIRAMPLK